MPDMSPDTAGGLGVLERPDESLHPENPWKVLLWNDPVNVMSFVVGVLQEVLKCTEAEADRYMLTAHVEGKAAVFTGTQDEATAIAAELSSYSLWATTEKG